MVQGYGSDGKSELEAKEPWNACQSASLEAEILGE